ncbi:MAG: hypothetical protein WBD02_09240, partial [Acidimicrobiia bacterium]
VNPGSPAPQRARSQRDAPRQPNDGTLNAPDSLEVLLNAVDWLLACTLVLAALLSAAALFAWFRLMRAVTTFQADSSAFWAEADALLDEMRAQARQAERHVARTEALIGSAEGLEQTFEGASRFAVRTITNPVVKAMAASSGMRHAWHTFRGKTVPSSRAEEPAKPRMRIVSGES